VAGVVGGIDLPPLHRRARQMRQRPFHRHQPQAVAGTGAGSRQKDERQCGEEQQTEWHRTTLTAATGYVTLTVPVIATWVSHRK
jgi:hypothetical protein